MDWISSNKEWLFSGCGVVAFVWMLNVLRDKVAKPAEASCASPVVGPTVAAMTPPPLIDPITADEIREVLRAAPPLQVAATAARFCGIWVQWSGALSFAQHEGQLIRVSLVVCSDGHLPTCSFTVSPADFPSLAIKPSGAALTVRGRIKHAETLWIELEDATLNC